MSSNFTCINCNVRYNDCELQREHYKSDWHRYNLKRRVAELPPVTAEEFQTRINQLRTAEAVAVKESQTLLYCTACRKQFSNQKSYDNHEKSKKHKDNVHYPTENGMVDTSKVVTTKSIISSRPHPAVAAAAAGKGQYALKKVVVAEKQTCISDDEYEDLEDEDDIDSDEWDKIAENPLTVKDCLFCPMTSEDIVENLKHMSVAHSFFIPDAEFCMDLEGLLFYLGEKVANYFICLQCNDRGKTFYSLDAVRKHMIDKGHCQMLHEGPALAEYADYYDYSSSYPDNVEGMDVDTEVDPNLLDGDEYQLVLPSGAVIGHRSLLRYYKQHLNPNRSVVLKKADQKLHKVLTQYRALGWTHTNQQAAARKARDIHVMQRAKANWQMKLGCKANKLQKHFRVQILC